MQKISMLAIALLMMASGAAFAGQPLYPVQNCNSLVAQPDLNACAETNYEASDAALNATYKNLMARLPDAKSRDDLRKTERLWIVRRDKLCNEEASPDDGGSIGPMDMSNCLEKQTAARLRELKRRLDCAERTGACSR
jgi:uncharacterized protein YecT (DUF1311 family)